MGCLGIQGYAIKKVDPETRGLIDAAIKAGKAQKCPPRTYSVQIGEADIGTNKFNRQKVNRELTPEQRALAEKICKKHGMLFSDLMPTKSPRKGSVKLIRETLASLHDLGMTYAQIGHCFDRTRGSVASIISKHREDEKKKRGAGK